MKHALAVIVLAGIGSAAWYRPDIIPRQTVAKIQVPDPGPLPESEFDPISLDFVPESADFAPEWEPTEAASTVPEEPAPRDQIAELPGAIRAVSDEQEQPFAMSEEDEEEVDSLEAPPQSNLKSPRRQNRNLRIRCRRRSRRKAGQSACGGWAREVIAP